MSPHGSKTMLQLLLLTLASALPLLVSAGRLPAFTMPMANLTVHVGKNATFTCHVNHIQGYKVGWVKADTKAIQAIGDVVIVGNPRITVSHENTQKHHLHITSVTLEDAGPYMCQLNTDPMKSMLGFLNVIVPADISQITGAEGIVEGGRARLVCEASGFPTPKVYWTREDRTQTIATWDEASGSKREVSTVRGPVLELPRVMRSQMGTYLCIANNGHSPVVSRRVDLAVSFRPVISVQDPLIVADEGNDVIVECLIEAFPPGVHYWETSREQMITSNHKYLVHDYHLNKYSLRTRLTILNFEPEDSGAFKCVCKNAMSSADGVQGVVQVLLRSEYRASLTTTTTKATTKTSTSYQGDLSYEDMYNMNEKSNNHYNWISGGLQTTVFKLSTTVRPPWYDFDQNRRKESRKENQIGRFGSMATKECQVNFLAVVFAFLVVVLV